MDWVQSRPQGFNCASAHSSENASHKPWFSFFVRRTEHFRLPLGGVNHAEWPKDEHENTPTETRRHLLPAQSRGHRTPPAQHQALTTRKETISDIWSSPVLKPKPETQLEQKITTSTPNIISGRCPRTEGRHRTLLQRPLLSKAGTLSEPSSVTSEDVCHEEQATRLLQKGRDWLLRCMQGNHPKFLTKGELRTARALASPCRRLCSPAPTR